MGNKPKNAIKGLQGFQRTGRTDPVGHSSGIWGRLLTRFGFGARPTSPSYDAHGGPPLIRGGDYDASYQAFSSTARASNEVAWPDAQTLSDSERKKVWSETFYRSSQYGAHRRFDIHEAKHDQIADLADLLKSEGQIPRRVGRPGVDDFAYVRQGDIELQVLAAKQLPHAILDLGTPEHSRYEGLGVYSRDTIALARELEEAGRYNDGAFMQRGGFTQPDGTTKETDVIHHKVWRLVQLVERDQAASERLQSSRAARAASAAASGRFAL